MSNYYPTSEDELDLNDNITFEKKKVDSPNGIKNEKSTITTILLLQEVSSNSVNH
ncbi:9255_t:CDS:1, partial [Dentiscutata heterogama]